MSEARTAAAVKTLASAILVVKRKESVQNLEQLMIKEWQANCLVRRRRGRRRRPAGAGNQTKRESNRTYV